MFRRETWILALLSALAAQPAAAQAVNLRNWIAKTGVTSSGCGAYDTPCRSFSTAQTTLSPGGEIAVKGDWFPDAFVVITKSLSFVAGGGLVTINSGGGGGTAITVNAPAGSDVSLKGLNLGGLNIGGIGIQITGAGKVSIQDCRIHGFSVAAIEVAGGAGARVLVDSVTMTRNGAGIRVKGAGGAANSAFVRRSVIDGSTTSGLVVDGSSNTVVISGSQISGSGGPDLSAVNGGVAISYGDNLIRTGNPTQTLQLK